MTARRGAVLLVDDEPAIRQTYATALRSAGHEVEIAANAEEAKRVVSRVRLTAALIDLRMTGEDGLALLTWLRQHVPGVPVAIVTAYGDVPSAVEAMRRGAHDFAMKPRHPSALRELVARLVDAADAEPGDYQVAIADAIRLGRAGDVTAAWLRVRQALASDPTRPEALNVLGVLTEKRGERIAAQSFHRAALALDPTYGPSRDNLERLTSSQGFGAPAWGVEPS